MAKINILDHQTIDKIAAGEVVERPASVVKELVENAIDAGASAVTVEIREGGTTLIRVTDNGGGIEKSQVENAFLRHATSKISSVEDLTSLVSLGFRGEALASIAAVAQVELVTKTPEELTGIRYVIEGGIEKEREEIGAPTGTTLIVRNLFFNTPPRKKFLKQPRTEGSYVAELMEHLAMSNPKVSFKFLINGQTKFYTTGSGDLREIVYRIYGKEISGELLDFSCETEGMRMTGLLGKPAINRANRSFEIFYINGRYIRSALISKAVEEGYREYLMQHKFPFCILHFAIDTEKIDVNVHPSKLEVRIADAPAFHEAVKDAVYEALHGREMIPEVALADGTERKERAAAEMAQARERAAAPEPFEERRLSGMREAQGLPLREKNLLRQNIPTYGESEKTLAAPNITDVTESAEQINLFESRILSQETRPQFEIIGQIFETYWLIVYEEKLLIVDQHAAHEKVKYERLMKHFLEKDVPTQALNPPTILTLSNREKECLLAHRADFEALGFLVEEFGGNDFCIRGVPMDLYGYGEAEFFGEVLDELADEAVTGTPESIRIRIATMACKAAVKGNMRMSRAEMETLLDELLTLENPYNCPHGRPTIISMSKNELERKFKRIV
ncbi:MAG: DNA mismatch repair endonuclease MutL [Bacteroidales bacterium]|nr:DNA mismatch repair endonuclease MutL [Bacteroidales bacterium]MCM1414434.1 DNA mismatch repair endonuclease MutL [bacterium]MCM1422313.1 DNA mismatch repair endonuclease MutL [bacterium]